MRKLFLCEVVHTITLYSILHRDFHSILKSLLSHPMKYVCLQKYRNEREKVVIFTSSTN